MALEQTQRTGADRNVMRDLNRSLVLDILRGQSPISRAAIAKVAQLTKPTVSTIVDDLITDGLVTELGAGATTTAGGRPPILLEFNERSQFVVGVHVDATQTTIVVADALGAEVGRSTDRTPKGKPGAQLAAIGKRILAVSRDHGVDVDRIAAAGVVVPGLTDYLTGVCLSARSLGWYDVPVAGKLGPAVGLPVFVHHPGQAAVVAEHVEGAGQGFDNVALLHTGDDLAAGAIVGGRVFHAARGIAAEIGHNKVPGNDEPCACGGVGCLETLATTGAIVRLAQAAIADSRGRKTTLRAHGLTASAVAVAAANGDDVATHVIGEVGRNLGLGAAWLANTFNPEVIVVGGTLQDIGEPLLGPLRDAAYAAMLPAVRTDIRPSPLGADAEVRGAVLLALQQSRSYHRLLFQG